MDVEGVEAMGSPLTATVATGALGAGSFRDLPMPGERQEKQEKVRARQSRGTTKKTLALMLAEQTGVPCRVSLLLRPSLPTGIPVGGSPGWGGTAGWGMNHRAAVEGSECLEASLRFGACHQPPV